MSLIALLIALLIEQLRPRVVRDRLHRTATVLADAARKRLGEPIGWILLVGLAVLAVWLLDGRLRQEYPVVVFVLHVVILYDTIGFRRLGHAFARIRSALVAEEPGIARSELEAWLAGVDATRVDREGSAPGTDHGASTPDTDHDGSILGADRDDAASEPELCRKAAGAALIAMHRHLFAPLFWYLLLPGVAGPVLYRLCAFLDQHWSTARARPDASLPAAIAARAFYWIDWPAVRFSAAGFAIMGNFEDVLYSWRAAVAAGTGDDAQALLLAAGSGALGVRLADTALEARWAVAEPSFEYAAAPPDARTLRAVVSLIWRAAALWVGLLTLLTIAGWLGR